LMVADGLGLLRAIDVGCAEEVDRCEVAAGSDEAVLAARSLEQLPALAMVCMVEVRVDPGST